MVLLIEGPITLARSATTYLDGNDVHHVMSTSIKPSLLFFYLNAAYRDIEKEKCNSVC